MEINGSSHHPLLRRRALEMLLRHHLMPRALTKVGRAVEPSVMSLQHYANIPHCPMGMNGEEWTPCGGKGGTIGPISEVNNEMETHFKMLNELWNRR